MRVKIVSKKNLVRTKRPRRLIALVVKRKKSKMTQTGCSRDLSI